MHASILICTFNRAGLLAETLGTIAVMHVDPTLQWEVIVVDNNSTDNTRAVTELITPGFPVPVRVIFEPRQGKSHALNTGIEASSAEVIVFTDDDVQVAPDWLETGVRPLITRRDIDYTGGPVHPLWDATPPEWINGKPGILWGPIALVDYGTESFIFEDRQRIPMGVNMAVRRSLIARVGGFHPDLERSGSSLMGQGQAEFFFRTRAAGIRGLYVPEMKLKHHVPASRMTRKYYRRWWYWKGIARARMQAIHPVSELGIDLRTAPRIAGIPRFMWGSAFRDLTGWLEATGRGNETEQAEHEMMLAFFAGYTADRMRKRRLAAPPAAAKELG
jgi:glucosyl-dolichyl phosphate glucuronosyltransferase